MNNGHVIIVRPMPNEKPSYNALPLPLGPLYLAESLLAANYRVNIIDTDNKNAIREIEDLISNDTLCIGISTMSGMQLGNAIIIAKYFKTKYPGLALVWGGVHITALPHQTLQNELVDYIVWGEGEISFVRLLNSIRKKDFDSLNNIEGIGFKQNGNQVVTKNSGYTSLNKTFNLPYFLLDMDRYARKLLLGAEREFMVWTSRGCPFNCNFCFNSSTIWSNRKVRFHTVESIVADVKKLVNEYHADTIYFTDENFIFNKKRMFEILEAIRKEKIFIKFRFISRIDTLLKLDKYSWEKLKKYGLIFVGTGIESGSQRILDYMNKRITLEQIYKMDDLLTEFEINKGYNFMICMPTEKKEDMRQTLRLIIDLARNSTYCPYPIPSLTKYIPMPGTKMYLDAVKMGFKPPLRLEEWIGLDDMMTEKLQRQTDPVRPWVSREEYDYVEQVLHYTVSLNSLYTGKDAKMELIEKTLNEIDKFIKSE